MGKRELTISEVCHVDFARVDHLSTGSPAPTPAVFWLPAPTMPSARPGPPRPRATPSAAHTRRRGAAHRLVACAGRQSARGRPDVHRALAVVPGSVRDSWGSPFSLS